MHKNPYRKLIAMFALSFAAMYALMYAMVDSGTNIYQNVNQAYMAGLMAAPMVIIELVVMWSMYSNRSANIAILAISAVAAILFFASIRVQAGVMDQQFLRSMIPHHAGAILMCEQATLEDDEIQRLCEQIIESQRTEIAKMRAKLDEISQ